MRSSFKGQCNHGVRLPGMSHPRRSSVSPSQAWCRRLWRRCVRRPFHLPLGGPLRRWFPCGSAPGRLFPVYPSTWRASVRASAHARARHVRVSARPHCAAALLRDCATAYRFLLWFHRRPWQRRYSTVSVDKATTESGHCCRYALVLSSPEKKRRVAVVDDHEFVRTRLCEIIDGIDGATSVGRFSTGHGLCEEPANAYDAALVDLHLPDIPGQLVLRRVRQTNPTATLIAITGYADAKTVRYAIEAGAVTCLSKSTSTSELRIYLQAALLGAVIIDPHTQQLVSQDCTRGEESRGCREGLTVREMEVLALLARGVTARTTAEQLFISEATVRSHRNRIYQKLGLRSRSDATCAYRRLIGDIEIVEQDVPGRAA
jgi:DNA-binding NarL/FixJ family response regulator